MKKIIFLIPLLIIGQVAYADVAIQNDQKYIDDDGLLHIIGEIENNSKVPLNQIQISATLIDENDANIGEISSNTIGTMVMEGLKELDPVAYVRFASVYRNFREEKDFVQFVDKLDVYKKR